MLIPAGCHTPYIPPHAQKGSPYHRYTILLLPQAPLDGLHYPTNALIQERLDLDGELRPNQLVRASPSPLTLN